MQSRKRASGRGHFHWWVAFVGFAAAAACGGSSRDGPVPPGGQGATGGRAFPVGGSGGSAGRGGAGGKAGSGTGGDSTSGGGEAGAPPEPGGPIVEVTSPPAVSDPSDGGVLVDAEVMVTCEARAGRGGEPLDTSRISIELLDPDGNTVDEVAAATSGEPNEFFARVILSEVSENGRVGFRCTAADTSDPALTADDTVWSYVDFGPSIEVTSPVPDSAHAFEAPVRFRFRVDSAPVDSPDPQAAVDEVTLEVAGVSIDPGEPDDGAYDVTVSLNDTAVFPDVLSGTVPVTITARNRREPAPATRTFTYWFVIDGEGPVVTITDPKNSEVVGGQVPLHFTVVDELSPVDRESIVVRLNTTNHRYGEGGTWLESGSEYTFLFDSVQAQEDVFSQATITISATDEAGNTGSGAALTVNLDNQPPIVDLNPPMIREQKPAPNDYCSLAFDPIGTLPPADLSSVMRAQYFRALVWERTNQAPGQMIPFHAGTDEGSVFLYMQPDPSEALLVDGDDGDGICSDLIETREQLPFQQLEGLNPQGNSWFGSMANDTEALPDECSYENLSDAPDPLCQPFGSDLTRVIQWDYDSQVSVIYATSVIDNSAACVGSHWETAQFGEGWACFAARALDRVGNIGISPPLRVCIDDGIDPPPDCSGTPPSCTDGCAPPAGFPSAIIRIR